MDLQEFYKKVKPDKQRIINIREVVHVEFRNFEKEKVLRILIELLAEQEGAEVEYTIEETA